MAFTQNWFEVTGAAVWASLFIPRYRGKPNLKFLEVGSHEGGSTVWTCKNLLTGPDCKLDCVDTWGGSVELQYSDQERDRLYKDFIENTRAYEKIINIHKMTSFEFLTSTPFVPNYDFIYVDGSHVAKDVMADAILSWPRLKLGGVMVFDDYVWRQFQQPWLLPRLAIDAFLAIYRPEIHLIYMGDQVMVEKIENTTPMS